MKRFVVLFFILLLASALGPAFLPRRLVGLGFGTIALLTGLILLEVHNEPLGSDGDRSGLGQLTFMVWLTLALVGFVVRLATDGGLSSLATVRSAAAHTLLSWTLPIGVLLAVMAMHWISNRLAGASPAWRIHLLVGGGAGMLAVWMMRGGLSATISPDLRQLGIITAAGLSLLVAKAAISAPMWAATAREEAAGAPYCMLTFAGREHPRLATTVLELSPLVSRSGARSFVDDAYWLVVTEGGVHQPKRWQLGWGGRSGFEDAYAGHKPACLPVPGGNLR